MTDEMMSISAEAKSQQHRNMLIVSGVAVIISLVIYYCMSSGSPDEASRKKAEAASFSHPVEQVNAESLWIERMQNKLKDQERQTTELKNELVKIKNHDNQKSIEGDPRYQAMLKQNE